MRPEGQREAPESSPGPGPPSLPLPRLFCATFSALGRPCPPDYIDISYRDMVRCRKASSKYVPDRGEVASTERFSLPGVLLKVDSWPSGQKMPRMKGCSVSRSHFRHAAMVHEEQGLPSLRAAASRVLQQQATAPSWSRRRRRPGRASARLGATCWRWRWRRACCLRARTGS